MVNAAKVKLSEATSALLGLVWDDKQKRWFIRAEHKGRLITLCKVETTRELDESGLFLIADAIKQEMEAWVI